MASEKVLAEVQKRWAMHYTFDLEPQEWRQLLSQFHPGDVLQAIKIVHKRCTADDPAGHPSKSAVLA